MLHKHFSLVAWNIFLSFVDLFYCWCCQRSPIYGERYAGLYVIFILFRTIQPSFSLIYSISQCTADFCVTFSFFRDGNCFGRCVSTRHTRDREKSETFKHWFVSASRSPIIARLTIGPNLFSTIISDDRNR